MTTYDELIGYPHDTFFVKNSTFDLIDYIFSIMKIILFGIVFIIIGLVACGVAFYLGRPESVKKAAIAKPSSIIFYIIGALTVVTGILFLIFSKDLTKKAFQIFVLSYLVCLTVLMCVFTALIKVGGKK